MDIESWPELEKKNLCKLLFIDIYLYTENKGNMKISNLLIYFRIDEC